MKLINTWIISGCMTKHKKSVISTLISSLFCIHYVDQIRDWSINKLEDQRRYTTRQVALLQ